MDPAASSPVPQEQAPHTTPADNLPLSFAPAQEQPAAAAASLLESSWAGVLDFTHKQSTAKQPSVSAASTGMGSDWQVLKLTNDECSSSARSLPDSLASSTHDVAADCQGSEASCVSAGKNEAIADLLLQSTDLEYSVPALAPAPEPEAEAAEAAPPSAPPSTSMEAASDADEYAGLLDLDSFDAVKAQRPVSSEGSVDGFSEASFPSSPRMRLLEASDELEVEMQVGEDVTGLLPYLAEQLRSTCQQLRSWWEGQQQLLQKALRHGTVDAIAALDALLPASLRQALLKLRMALNRHPSNWTVIALSVSVAGLAAMLVASHASNTKMARLLDQKDRELARLVVKIFTLQDTLQNPHHTPIIRHTHLPTTAMHPLF